MSSAWQADSLPTELGGKSIEKLLLVSEVKVVVKVTQSCLTLATPWTVARKVPLSMGFSRQEFWSGLPFLSPGDLPHPGTEPKSALAGGFLPLTHQRSPFVKTAHL